MKKDIKYFMKVGLTFEYAVASKGEALNLKEGADSLHNHLGKIYIQNVNNKQHPYIIGFTDTIEDNLRYNIY